MTRPVTITTRLIFLFLLASAAANPVRALDNSSCSRGKGRVVRRVKGFQIRISPLRDKNQPDVPLCEVEIFDSKQNVIFSENDWRFSIVLAGQDVNGDGIPDAVLESYSGGAHCCWTYYIVSLGSNPGLITKSENQRDASFYRDGVTGKFEISTLDGSFDYFDGLCHACTPFPVVFLRLEGAHLVDVSSQHIADYDEIIRENQQRLTAEDFRRLRALEDAPTSVAADNAAVGKVLNIVLAYLYSGREALARQGLDRMWPQFDQERMWELITETSRAGILSYTTKSSSS